MPKLIRSLLFWILILYACAPTPPPGEASPQNEPPAPPSRPAIATAPTEVFPDSPALPIPRFSRTLETPHIDQPPDGAVTAVPATGSQDCGYQWAYKDLPELSKNFMQSVQTLQPGAQATAFGFGENCVHPDGTATFIPMETDFNVTVQVTDLADEASLGEWIVKIMQVIGDLPPDQIVGPRPGRVTLLFEANGKRKAVNFYIDQYHALPAGLSASEIYQAFQAPQ